MFAKHPLALLILLALAGCSSLHVDVDVYKGPLINEPDIQLEQVASLALSARPLIRTMIQDTISGGYDQGSLSPYARQIRASLEELAAMIDNDGSVSTLLYSLAEDIHDEKDVRQLPDLFTRADARLAGQAASLGSRERLAEIYARLLDETSYCGEIDRYHRHAADRKCADNKAKQTFAIERDVRQTWLAEHALAKLSKAPGFDKDRLASGLKELADTASHPNSCADADNFLRGMATRPMPDALKAAFEVQPQALSATATDADKKAYQDKLNQLQHDREASFACLEALATVNPGELAATIKATGGENSEAFAAALPLAAAWTTRQAVANLDINKASRAVEEIRLLAQDQPKAALTATVACTSGKSGESKDQKKKCKKKLRTELTAFAERARGQGNHSKLFLSLLDEEMATRYGISPPSPSGAEAHKKLRKAIETYSLILQTIGNSILSQANEIRRLDELNDDERNDRLKEREQAVWRSVGMARLSVLAAVKKRAGDQWLFQDKLPGKLLEALNETDKQSSAAASILSEAIPVYQKAAASLEQAKTAFDKLADTACNLSEGTATALLDACLGKDSKEHKLLVEELPGQDKPIADPDKVIKLPDLRKLVKSLVTQLEKWKADAALFQIWKARLENAESLLAGLDKVKVENPREAVDLAVSRLRGLQVEATLAGDDEQRQRIEEAIQILLAHRAGMVPLVPAASYLRNSLPATSLQGISERDDSNMLWQAFKRAFPDTQPSGEDKLRQDMDKQYWQSVNRVRVSGGGSVNQVLAKDDVGNWYVKSYDTDKKAIFQTMKKLALFNLAGQVPALGALRTQLAETKGLEMDSLKLSDLGIGVPAPATPAGESTDPLTAAQPTPTETAASTPNGTAADVYKAALIRYSKVVLDVYQDLQCGSKTGGTADGDGCEGDRLTTKALEDLGKKDLKTLDGEVVQLLGTRTTACKPDVANTACTTTASAPATATASAQAGTPSTATSVATGDRARFEALSSLASKHAAALKRLMADMETISAAIGKPLR
ncbi:MAG: hypothetical protein Q8O33_08555 [Pseudomonadota bacterium]|nr:hypothetical protein [Pseudomonadota bacterium]